MKGKLLATLGLGAALVLGNASSGLASDNPLCEDQNTKVATELLDHASFNLATDDDWKAIVYLNYIIDPEGEPRPDHIPSLDEIEPKMNTVIDTYIECDEVRPELYVLAETFNEERRKDKAFELLKEELSDYHASGWGSFAYHVFMVYDQEMREHFYVEDVHKELVRVYEENEFGDSRSFWGGTPQKFNVQKERDMLKHILTAVEEGLPNSESDLMIRIRNYETSQ